MLQNLTEDELVSQIKQWVSPLSKASVGIGDDCAVLTDGSLFKTDCVVEGQHFSPETPAFRVGRKAVGRVISDFAAMGGEPTSLLVTIGLRKDTPLKYVKELYEGMVSISKEYGAEIVGGETTSIPTKSAQFISISGTGSMRGHNPVLRSGASSGDSIYVTGSLGGSFPTEHHLLFSPRKKEAKWLVENVRPSAMMDLSDGLARDLPRLASASMAGYTLDYPVIPVNEGFSLQNALSDGEDYELLFTLPPVFKSKILTAPFKVSCIGEVTKDTPQPLSGGWDHLAKSPLD